MHPVQSVPRHGPLARRPLGAGFPRGAVAIYGGQGNSFLLEGDRRRGAAREEIQAHVRDRSLRMLVATDAASEGLNLQRLETLVNVDLPWNPARLEQRKGRIDRIGQLAAAIDILNLRYRSSVEDQVHSALSSRLQQIRSIFGTIPTRSKMSGWRPRSARSRKRGAVSARFPPPSVRPALRSGSSRKAWERCAEVLDRQDVLRVMKQPW